MQWWVMSKGKRKAKTPFAWFFSSKQESIFSALCSEQDRGQVLVGAAILDDALRECLGVRLDRAGVDPKLKDRLLEGDSALFGSFWARINTCRAFGGFSDTIYDVLEAIRVLRNSCAHSDYAVTLDTPEISGPRGVIEKFAHQMLAEEPPDKNSDAHGWWQTMRSYYDDFCAIDQQCSACSSRTKNCRLPPTKPQLLFHVAVAWIYAYVAATATTTQQP